MPTIVIIILLFFRISSQNISSNEWYFFIIYLIFIILLDSACKSRQPTTQHEMTGNINKQSIESFGTLYPNIIKSSELNTTKRNQASYNLQLKVNYILSLYIIYYYCYYY